MKLNISLLTLAMALTAATAIPLSPPVPEKLEIQAREAEKNSFDYNKREAKAEKNSFDYKREAEKNSFQYKREKNSFDYKREAEKNSFDYRRDPEAENSNL